MTPVPDPDKLHFSNGFGVGDICVAMLGPANSLEAKLFRQFCYLLPKGWGEGEHDLSLEDVWASRDGCLVLLGDLPTDWAAFASHVRELRTPRGRKLLWVANPADDPQAWCSTFLRLSSGPEPLELKRDAHLPFTADAHGYGIHLPAGVKIQVSGDGVAAALKLVGSEGGMPSFGCGEDRLRVEGDVEIELTKPSGLRFGFEFVIPGGRGMERWLDVLDIGMRYAFHGGSEQEDREALDWMRFPVISAAPGVAAIPISALVAPMGMSDPEQSNLRVRIEDSEHLKLFTWFRTISGKPIYLAPIDLQFRFSPRPEVLRNDRSGRLTLVPHGSCTLLVGTALLQRSTVITASSVAAGVEHLLCGTSGTEYVELSTELLEDGACQLEFVSGRPALAAGLGRSPDEAPLTDALSSSVTTAWVRITAGETALDYYSQPPGDASMYRADPDPAGVIPVLGYHPIAAAKLPVAAIGRIEFPMVSMAGIPEGNTKDALRLEVQAISPTRKSQLGVPLSSAQDVADGEGAADALPFTCVTPRGLECVFTETEGQADTWTAVRVAQIVEGAPQPGGPSLPTKGAISLTNIRGPLKSAMLATQQCLVISDPTKMAEHLSEEAVLVLEGWGFNVAPDVEDWERLHTILIVKNADARLEDLALDTGSWTNAQDFNSNPRVTRDRLKEIFAAAHKCYGEDVARVGLDPQPAEGEKSDFEFFVETILGKSSWNGFLFLNVPVEVPDTLGGLEAGIDLKRFKAHHLGVTQRLFKSVEDLLDKSSSIFGLIRYEEQSPGFCRGSRYAFRVNSLGVAFKDSTLVKFRAVLDLSMASLFGKVPVEDTEDTEDAKLLQLDGILQKRGGKETYMFSLRTPRQFSFSRGPLEFVKISQAEFDTYHIENAKEAPAEGADAAARTISSRFSFVGCLQLAKVTTAEDDFDVLSFNELGFSDLRLDMEYVEGKPTGPQFDFQIDNMMLEDGRSKARDGSLFQGFPVRLNKMLGGDGEQTGSKGYMTVTQAADVSPVGSNWYGVDLTLDMGTLSDVAGGVGLEASLLTAWGQSDGEVFLGLKLPGSSGAGMSLLGVLKMTMYSLSMRRADRAWALMLNGINLKVFSKKLPPNGSFDFYLFGNPDPGDHDSSLGWYGAYVRDEDEGKDEKTDADAKRLTAPGPARIEAEDVPVHDSQNTRFPPLVPRGHGK